MHFLCQFSAKIFLAHHRLLSSSVAESPIQRAQKFMSFLYGLTERASISAEAPDFISLPAPPELLPSPLPCPCKLVCPAPLPNIPLPAVAYAGLLIIEPTFDAASGKIASTSSSKSAKSLSWSAFGSSSAAASSSSSSTMEPIESALPSHLLFLLPFCWARCLRCYASS